MRLRFLECSVQLALSPLFGLTLPTTASAQTGERAIIGAIADSGGRPVPHVTVWLAGVQRSVSDDSGRFRLTARRDQLLKVDFRRLGYRPSQLRLEAGSDTSVSILLVPVAAQLPATHVTAQQQVRSLELSGFYSRMAERDKWGGSGQFITPEEIEFRKPVRTTQLLDGRHGVHLRRFGSCNVMVRCWVPLGPNECDVTMYLNGVRLKQPGAVLPSGGMVATAMRAIHSPSASHDVVFLDELAHPSAVAGIEVYQRATAAPPQYQILNGACGVILVWTK